MKFILLLVVTVISRAEGVNENDATFKLLKKVQGYMEIQAKSTNMDIATILRTFDYLRGRLDNLDGSLSDITRNIEEIDLKFTSKFTEMDQKYTDAELRDASLKEQISSMKEDAELRDASLKEQISSMKEDLRERMMNLTDSQKVMEKKVEDSQKVMEKKVEELQQGQQLLFEDLRERMMTLNDSQKVMEKKVEGLLCLPPARVVLPFGCVSPVREMKTWSEAQENCERLGKTLLEGISSQRELEELNTHFFTFLIEASGYGAAWVGMEKLTWVKGGDPAPPSSSSLWRSGDPRQPGSGEDCGFADFYGDGRAYLADTQCSRSWSSLCQTKKN